MDSNDHARITDFGLARATQNLDSMRSASEEQGHTARWTAPEILNEQGAYSKEADVFAFAMVMIEVQSEFVTCTEHRLTAISYPYRRLRVRFLSTIVHLEQSCWQ